MVGLHKWKRAFVCCIGRRFVVVDEDVEYRREALSEESVQVGKSLVLLAEWHPSMRMAAGVVMALAG